MRVDYSVLARRTFVHRRERMSTGKRSPPMIEVIVRKFGFFSERLLGAFLACAFWMTRGDFRLITPQHWRLALETAFLSSTILLLLSFTEFDRLQQGRYRKLLVTAIIVAIVDHFVHPSHFGGPFSEAIVTGVTAAGLVGMFGLALSAIS